MARAAATVPRTDCGVEAHDPALAVQGFKKPGQEPEREQFEKGSDQAEMDETVGERLPQCAVEEEIGLKAEGI